MSNFYSFIEELCPVGVTYKNLGDVCEFQRGSSITQKGVITGNVPVIAGGQTPSYYHNISNREGDVIAVSASGAYAGYVSYWTVPVFLSDSFSVNPDPNVLNKRYVYYYLKNNQSRIHDTKKGGGVPHVYGSSISKFLIPIPPLPIQQEIVNILDKFTQLEAELAAELEARKLQYEYYSNTLLNSEDKNIEMKTLGEVCTIQSGGTPSKNKPEYWNNGSIKWLGSTVCQNKKSVPEISGYITEDGLKSSSAKIFKEQTTLIALVGATIGKVAFLPFEATTNQNIAGLYPLDTTQLNTSYLYYSCKALYKTFTDLSQDKFTMANLGFIKNLKIPVPSIAEQMHIVTILDNFEYLVNDCKGLPAEINARKKQYEYYRNKLLTFKPLQNG